MTLVSWSGFYQRFQLVKSKDRKKIQDKIVPQEENGLGDDANDPTLPDIDLTLLFEEE